LNTLLLFALIGAPAQSDEQAPEQILSTRRSEIVLNGPWRFMPAEGPKPLPSGSWGRIWVPGDWRQNTGRPGVIEAGKGWESLNRNDLSAAWYERSITVPAGWSDRAVTLDIARVSTDAEVYLDDKKVGQVAWPDGTVDLTGAVRPGAPQKLRIKVISTPDAGEVPELMGLGQVTMRKADLAWRGIMGDVVLKSAPRGPRVSDVFVQPSVRKNQVALEVEIEGVVQPGEVSFTADMLDEKGKVERTFSSKALLKADPTQKVRLVFPWSDARRWDLGKPNLYTLRLRANGAGLSDDYAQTFGFRELWVEGRRFFLNGTEFRMRPTLGNDGSGIDEVADATIKALRARGFNIQEIWPENWAIRGSPEFGQHYVRRADRLGWPLMGPSTHLNPILSGWATQGWEDPERRSRWFAAYRRHLRKYQNHPSIVLWANSGNNFGNRDDQAPTHIGRRITSSVWNGEDSQWRKGNTAGAEAYRLLKEIDPTRPILAHQAGPISDVYAVNNYLNFVPLQEREDWLSEWAKDGDMPYSAVEFGTPLDCSFFRGRNGFRGAYTSEPCFTEYAAIYSGPAAYKTETPAYRQDIVKTFQGDQNYEFWMFVNSGNRLPTVEALQSLFVKNTWRSWRTWGVSGGMVPWSSAHGYDARGGNADVPLGPFVPGRRGNYKENVSQRELAPNLEPVFERRPAGVALEANNGPTLAWIAGGPKGFTSKDHSYFEGQRVQKQIALLNDTRETVPYRAEWRVVLGGKSLGTGVVTGSLVPGQTKLIPFSATLPKIAVDRQSGEVTVDATIGGGAHKDTFTYRVSKADTTKVAEVSLIDPVGKTRSMLKALGVPVRTWDGVSRDGLVVVGREAFASSPNLAPRLLDFVEKGGRVVVMPQRPEWYTDYAGLRVAETVSRRVFPIASVPFAGIDTEDLRDWRGTSTLKAPFRPGAVVPRETPSSSPIHAWRGSGQGGVSSVPLEKPHRTGWRPLLQCEFDMAYSPLMELGYGAGKLTLCTLDLEDHASQDPGAERVARRMLNRAATPPAKPKVSTVALLGSDADAQTLDLTGVRYRRANALERDTTVAVIGTGVELPEATKKEFLARGGKLLFLRRPGATASWAGAGVPAWEECEGLDRADLHPKVEIPVPSLPAGLEAGAGGALGREKAGSGTAIYFQLSPTELDADKKTYLRRTRWKQTRALATLLSNMGASFELDGSALSGKLAVVLPPTISLEGDWKAVVTQEHPDGVHEDPGTTPEARRLLESDAVPSAARTIKLPASFEALGKPWIVMDGETVFVRNFDVPASLLGPSVELDLGKIDDFDEVWINGQKVGGIDRTNPEAWNTIRRYKIPPSLLRLGSNRIAVRVWDRFGGGGFYPANGAFQIRKVLPTPIGVYSPDYRTDFELGDDPYRYFRW
jgi:beta-galactosidase